MRVYSIGVLFGAPLLLSLIIGCGGEASLVPVHGKVTFPDDSPLPGGWVEMESLQGQRQTPRGPIQSDGTFLLGTITAGDGAPPGKYAVQITPPPGPHPDRQESSPVPVVNIDPRFTTFATSGIEVEVSPSSENYLQFTVERPE